MFFLEVTYSDKKARRDRDDFDGKLKILEQDDVVISFLKGPLYAFQFSDHGRFLIGESSSGAHERLLQKHKGKMDDSQDLLTLLGGELYNLVIVDTANKNINLTQPISCGRPLYYLTLKNRFICSSHVGALKAAGLNLNPVHESYPEVCTYRYTLPPRSMYKGVCKLRKGQILDIDLKSGNIKTVYQWNTKMDKCINSSELPLHIKMIENVISSCIQNAHIPAKKMGILLSGGIDSALLAAICRKRDLEFDSFSSSFAFINKDDREDEYALSVAKHLGLDHTIVSSTPEQYLTDLVWAIHAAEEPVHHLQTVMLYRLFKEAARSNYDLFLCGEGADGLFGNDAHMKYYKHRERIKLGRITGLHWLFKTIYHASGLKNERLGYFVHDFGERFNSENHILWTLGRYGDPEIVRQYFKSSLKDIYESRMLFMSNSPDFGLMDRITALSLIGEGYKTMTIWSKLAEGNQIEIVYPYDHVKLIGHALEIPWSIKMQEEKYIIRSLLRKQEIPEEFITRPKLSFGFPVRFWAPRGALFQPLVDMAAEMFGPDFMRSLQSEEIPKAMILWSLINLYLWHKMLIEDARPENLCEEILDRRRSYQK